MELRAAAAQLVDLHQRLLARSPAEGAAFLEVEQAGERLLLRSATVFSEDQLEPDGLGELIITEDAQVNALAAFKRTGHALVEVHTHPGSQASVAFSQFDERQLCDFSRYVRFKLRDRPFGALVFGEAGYAGRAYTDSGVVALRMNVAGEKRLVPHWLEQGSAELRDEDLYDRQVRALGREGQRAISELTVGVVGLGGTGSQVVSQLAHLGVRDFVLVDDDRVERSNLPRLDGATWWDALIRRRKDVVARRGIRRLGRRNVRRTGSLRKGESLSSLRDVDLLIGCVDNDGARLVTSELAAAYLIPYLDIGVGIEGEGERASMGGRVSFHLPGGACLACADELDFIEAAEDLESEALHAVRIARGYARDRRVEPAIMPLNTVLVGVAMMELLAYVTGFRSVIPFVRYDAMTSRVVRQGVEVNPECPVCQPAFAMGDRQRIDRYELPRRR